MTEPTLTTRAGSSAVPLAISIGSSFCVRSNTPVTFTRITFSQA